MTRERMTFPGPAIFTHRLAVRISDVNYGGHLGHDALVSLLHEARMQFFRALGLEESDAGGAGVILSDLAVEYRGEAFFGQELAVEIAADEPSRAGCTLHYRVSEGEAGRLIATARTGLVFFDYRTRRIARTPDPYRAGVRALADRARRPPE